MQKKWSFAGTELISSPIISRFKREEDTYCKLFSDLSAEWISCDHTYKSVSNIGYHRQSDGKWITLYKGFFIIGNESGHLQRQNHTKKLAMPFWYVLPDTCCKWAANFEKVFPRVPVKLDLIHAVQRFTKSIRKRKQHRTQLARHYSLVFHDANDLGENRTVDTPAKTVMIENSKKF